MRQHGDLTIDEAVADPLIRMMMKADRQDPRDVRLLLASAAQRIDPRRRSSGLRGIAIGRPLPASLRGLRDCCGAEVFC